MPHAPQLAGCAEYIHLCPFKGFEPLKTRGNFPRRWNHNLIQREGKEDTAGVKDNCRIAAPLTNFNPKLIVIRFKHVADFLDQFQWLIWFLDKTDLFLNIKACKDFLLVISAGHYYRDVRANRLQLP